MTYPVVATVPLDRLLSFHFEGHVLPGLGTLPRPSLRLELFSRVLAFPGISFIILFGDRVLAPCFSIFLQFIAESSI